jgi:hypothetical protein
MHVILDNDEVWSDEDEPLQKQLRQLSGTGPTVLDEAIVADKEATDRRAVEEVTAKWAAEEAATERATEETMVKKAAEERAAEEAAGAARSSPALARRRQQSGLGGLRLPVAPPRQSNVPTGVFGNLGLSSFLSPFPPFFVGLHSLITHFAHVLSLRRGCRDGHGYRKCGYQVGSRAGSYQ